MIITEVVGDGLMKENKKGGYPINADRIIIVRGFLEMFIYIENIFQ